MNYQMSNKQDSRMGEKLAMSTQDFTGYALGVQDQIQTAMDAAFRAVVAKNQRGRQIHDLSQMAAVLRFQIAQSKGVLKSKEDKARLKPPDGDIRNDKGTDPYADYIKAALIEAKDQIVTLHKDCRRLRMIVESVQNKVQVPEDDTDVRAEVGADMWGSETELGKILGELELSKEEEAALRFGTLIK